MENREITSKTRVYEKIKFLGQGAFGEVTLVQDKKTKQQLSLFFALSLFLFMMLNV